MDAVFTVALMRTISVDDLGHKEYGVFSGLEKLPAEYIMRLPHFVTSRGGEADVGPS